MKKHRSVHAIQADINRMARDAVEAYRTNGWKRNDEMAYALTMLDNYIREMDAIPLRREPGTDGEW